MAEIGGNHGDFLVIVLVVHYPQVTIPVLEKIIDQSINDDW